MIFTKSFLRTTTTALRKAQQRYLAFSKSLSQKTLCSAPFPEYDNDPHFTSYEQLYDFSIKKPESFWDRVAKSRLTWKKPYNKVVSSLELTGERISWFTGGKLNASENCLDRHVAVDPDRVALIVEKDNGSSEEVTYEELLEEVCQIANMLSAHGVKKGQHVALFMPNSIQMVATMLACARIGAVHNVMFAGFSPDAVASRLIDSESCIVVTVDQAVRGGRVTEMKKVLDEALRSCPFVTKVFVSSRTLANRPNAPMSAKDFHLEAEMAKYSTKCKPVEMDSEDPLFVLYTTGSSGRVKGLVHTHAGYLLYAALTHQLVFNYQKGERFGCVADLGWITGHSYVVYGPLANGGTTLLFESGPVFPNPGRYWEMVARLKLNHMYLSPTALRLLLKHGDSWVQKYNRSSLKTLGCVGEPLNSEAWQWYHDVIGEKQCDVIDTYWQTETGGVVIAPRPSPPGAEIYPATPGRPFFGILPAIFDPNGKELKRTPGQKGRLCIKLPWPGMAQTIIGDHERYYRDFFVKSRYICGDAAGYDEHGQFQILGRVDDVISTSGHRIGTAEIEDAIDTHPAVAESAVVGFPHEIKGQGVYAFVILREGQGAQNRQQISDSIKQQVRNKIAGFAVPSIVHITPNLPKNRSGKIVRHMLRSIASGIKTSAEIGDRSALVDPSIIDALIKRRNELLSSLNIKL